MTDEEYAWSQYPHSPFPPPDWRAAVVVLVAATLLGLLLTFAVSR